MSSSAGLPRPRTVRGLSARLNANKNGNEVISEPSASVSKRPHLLRSCNLPATSNVTNVDDPDDSGLGIYSNRVSQVWSKTTRLPPKMPLSVECIIPENTDSGEVVCATSSSPVVADKQAEKLLDISIEESVPAVVAKDPTPPPSPQKRPRRIKRVAKDVKVAMTKLQNAQKFLDECAEDENEDVLIVEDSCVTAWSQSKNPSITIKIRSRSGIHRIVMNQRDSFADVICQMAKIENVSEEDIIMFFNDTTIHPYDSPQLLHLTVADIVDCHIRASDGCSSSEYEPIDDPMAIQLVFQATGNRSSKHSLSIRKDEPMEKVMREYCKVHNVPYDSVTFKFDGERVDPASTPELLDLESEFCIDVVQK